jgi:TonB family protein
MMTKTTSFRIAILKQIALISVLLGTGFLFSTKIVAQETKVQTHQQVVPGEQSKTPEDEPSFNHNFFSVSMGFSSWVASQIKYPSKSLEEKISGWVHVGYTVELDGAISNVNIIASPNSELGNAVVKAVESSPKWMPAKNKEAASPYKSSINIKFEIPERVTSSQDIPVFVLGEIPAYRPAYKLEELHRSLDEGQNPIIPFAKDASLEATNVAIKDWIDQHLRYPNEASKDKIEGTVTVRFIITKSGKLEDFIVINPVHPLLDAEALRILSLMPDWKPAFAAGEPRDVYYYTDVDFRLSK